MERTDEMSHLKFRPRVLGLSLLIALTSTMVAAGGAHAQYLIDNLTFAQLGINLAKFSGSQETTNSLVAPGLGIEIACANVAITEGDLLATVAHATFDYSACKTYSLALNDQETHIYTLGSELSKCAIEGGHIVIKAKLTPVLHLTVTYLLIQPLTGSLLALFKYVSGCALPTHAELGGTTAALIDIPNSDPQHLKFSPFVDLLLKDKLTYGKFTAYLDGRLTAKLIDAFAGKEWGAH
jgi:hypothetical protein